MKVGDLVRFKNGPHDPNISQPGILIKIKECIGVPGGMATVLWSTERNGLRNDWNYRVHYLEVVKNESR